MYCSERALKEEERRANAFTERMAVQSSFGDKYEQDAGRKIKEEAIREEQRTLRDIEKKFKADDDRERMKVENRKRELQKSIQVNRGLDERKKSEIEADREKDRKLKLKYEMDNRADEIKRKKELQDKQLKIEKTRSMLDEQVAIRMRAVKNESALTQLEVSLNRDLITKVEEDKDLYTKIVQKVKPNAIAVVTNNIF